MIKVKREAFYNVLSGTTGHVICRRSITFQTLENDSEVLEKAHAAVVEHFEATPEESDMRPAPYVEVYQVKRLHSFIALDDFIRLLKSSYAAEVRKDEKSRQDLVFFVCCTGDNFLRIPGWHGDVFFPRAANLEVVCHKNPGVFLLRTTETDLPPILIRLLQTVLPS